MYHNIFKITSKFTLKETNLQSVRHIQKYWSGILTSGITIKANDFQ